MIFSYLNVDDPAYDSGWYDDFPPDSELGKCCAILRKLGVRPGAPFHIGDPDSDDPHPLVTYQKYPPGVVLARHAHPTYRMELVLRGSFTNEHGAVVRPGDIMVNPAGEYYGPHTMGPDGCLTMEIFATQDGLETITMPGKTISEGFREANAHLLGTDAEI